MALRENESVAQDDLGDIDAILTRIPPRELELFAAASPSFKVGGFRKGNTAAVRARIRQLVSGSEPITDDLRRLLDKHRGDAPPADSALEAAKAAAERDAATKRKGLEARLEREIAKAKAAEDRAADAEARAEEASKEAAAMRRRAIAAEEALDFERRHAAELADANVERRLSEEFATWLGGRRAAMIAEAARTIPDCRPATASGDGSAEAQPAPLRRLLAAMERQAAADPAAASRSFLEARLASYTKALASASALIADSLSPSAELIAAHEALAEEAAHLSALLGSSSAPAPVTDIVSALEQEAAKASERELPEVQHLARRLADMGVLADASANTVRERVRARYAALYAKRGTPDEAEASSPSGMLRRAIANGEALVLLVDGHNALFALQSRYCRPQDHRGPPAEARDWLVADIAQMAASSPNCRVIIVFDGPERTESSPSGNVKVIYSGGGTSEVEHRADDVIVDELRFLSRSGARTLVATNDNGLASRAAKLGAKSLPPTALLEYLR